jgi:tetratricopeptide (TPR) repeat protein
VLLSLPTILFLAASTFDESYRAGLQALQQNRLTEARADLENATKLQPERSGAWLALAQTYRKMQEAAKADQAAERAVRLAGNDAPILRLLALFYSEGGQWGKAAEVQARYATAAPNDREAVLRSMDLYLQARDPERAIEAGKRTIGWEQRPEIRRLLGKAYAAANQVEASDVEFQTAIRLAPYDESYPFDYAQTLLQRQKFDAAIQVLLAAQKQFDKSAQIELGLGVAYYGLRRYQEAAVAFERTLALAPDIEQPYLFLGKMLDQVPEKAPELTGLFAGYEKAHPQNWAGYLLHAKGLLAQSQDTQASEALLKKASSLNSRAAEPHYVLGILLQQERRFDEAAQEFEQAAILEPADPATYYHLAQVYDRLQKHARAEAARARHAQLTNGMQR